ncbi:MAG: hypothetical protein CMP11_01525, partial [Zetaproteobacteria bacterium]|nr:hypothetical protein [Pseudobdellovibrionaceae bacterium]
KKDKDLLLRFILTLSDRPIIKLNKKCPVKASKKIKRVKNIYFKFYDLSLLGYIYQGFYGFFFLESDCFFFLSYKDLSCN